MNGLSVFAPRRFAALLFADAMNVSRDPMLAFAIVLSVLPSIALWLAGDAIDQAGLAAGVPGLSRYFVPPALVLPAILIGWVSGFLLIEDRDDGPLLALDVTPVGKLGFLAYRLTVSVMLTAAITAAAVQLLLPWAAIWLKVLVVVTIPADTALVAIVLLAFARNKVEGLALTKLINLAAILPLAAIIPSPLRFAAGVIPTYWLGELLGLPGEAAAPAWLAAVLLIATHICAGVICVGLFRRRTG